MTIGAVLPGSISKQFNVCGNPKCRCKDKSNPRKHGPQYKLGYSLGGKSSTIHIKEQDYQSASKMTDSFREMRSLQTLLHQESIRLCRDLGANEAMLHMQGAHRNLIRKMANPYKGSEFALKDSQEKWKIKAIDRQSELQKNKVKLRDLESSREKWRSEALMLRQYEKSHNKSSTDQTDSGSTSTEEAQKKN